MSSAGLSILSSLLVLALADPAHANRSQRPPQKRQPKGSVMRLSANRPDILEFAAQKGLQRPGYRLGIVSGRLIYTTDGWHTSREATAQLLHDHSYGFVIPELEPGHEPFDYRLELRIGASYDRFRSYEFQEEMTVPANIRRFKARVTGRVQGVNFRWNTQQRASQLGLSGWVKNLPGNVVELEVEGPHAAVEQLLEFCKNGPPGARVDSFQADEVEPIGESAFVISY